MKFFFLKIKLEFFMIFWRIFSGVIFLYALFAVSVWHFSQEFFPYKSLSRDFASFDEFPHLNGTKIVPTFNKLVFMVIDAWRWDFLFGNDSQMEYAKGHVIKGSSFSFISCARAPTVTMPRIKALTTGNSPNFIDIVFNLDTSGPSTLDGQDSWLWQMKYGLGKRMEFYGDDTWLRLFPGFFDVHDGTSSFYVSDTVTVDLNVTRHIEPVMARSNWDVAVLHYLGLDHVGHLSGPKRFEFCKLPIADMQSINGSKTEGDG